MSGHPGLSKLYTAGLPVLEGTNPGIQDVAVWLIRYERWCRTNDLHRWTFGGDTSSFEDAEKVIFKRDSLRYLHRAIESSQMASDLADNTPDNSTVSAITFIKRNWLAGKEASDVLYEQLQAWSPADEKHILKSIAEFSLLINNITPIIPSQRACEIFAERMPRECDNIVRAVDVNPGRSSVLCEDRSIDHRRSCREWLNAFGVEVQKMRSRDAARERRNGSLRDDTR